MSEEPTSPTAAGSARWRLADEMLAKASEREAEITEDMEQMTETLGGELVGLEFKFKSREGIVEKIGRQRRKYSAFLESDEEAAETIRDVLRYTIVGETETHADDVEAMLAELRARGYEWDEDLQPENNWYAGGAYRGININLTRGGLTFELQFHTRESLQAVRDNHVLYEEWRREDTPESRRKELETRMVARSELIPLPPGIERVGFLQG